ncbi:hypothetical protein BASA81_013831 [Batrachochytrium salamandrivorans]|nr:hypothetical protein BASA81_013831 [Batrachochytrium salamandrivorans]
MQAFFLQVAQYRIRPTHDMVELLTEQVALMPDLREREQQQCFALIEELAQVQEKECEEEERKFVLDEASIKLVEMISGKSLNYITTQGTHQLVRVCLGALCSGDDDILREGMEKLLSIYQLTPEAFGLSPQIGFKDLSRLLLQVPSVPMGSIKATKEQVAALSCAFNKVALPHMVLQDAFEVMVDPSNNAFPTKEPTILLFHCTRNKTNIASILQQGLQVKGTAGRLGAAIYLADALEKSMGYCFRHTSGNGNQYAVAFIVEAALGRRFETKSELTKLPIGYDSVFAKGEEATKPMQPVPFSDGTSSCITPMGSARTKINSNFTHNEYTVYTPNRVRLRFMLMFSDKPNTVPTTVEKTLPSHHSSVDLFEATQRQCSFRKKLLARVNSASKEFGANSPQVKRTQAILEEVNDSKSIQVFLKSKSF